MRLQVEIRRNEDGVVAKAVWPDWDYNEYWWREGNASCDCNRKLYFLEAKGYSPALDSVECSEGNYSVRLSDADTGEVLYDELNAPAAKEKG